MQPFLTLTFCIALERHLPEPELRSARWHSPTWERSGCSRATSRPPGGQFCQGQPLPISENEVLFQLIGTTYGGDGETTFNLPDLRGRLPLHQGNGFILAETGGAEEVTLTVNQIPAHAHPLLATTAVGTAASPQGSVLAASGSSNVYRQGPAPGAVLLSNQTVAPVGGSQPHTNFQPYLCIDFIISLFGIFPSSELGLTCDPFVAEIRIFPFNFAPKGWAWCDGQLLPLSQNTALFSLLGTTYGGDGKSTFALPDLEGRAPMHPGQGPGLSLHDLGEPGGSETVTLLQSEIPSHNHTVSATNGPANLQAPASDRILGRANNNVYLDNEANLAAMAPEALAPAGGDQPHNNMQPYLTLYFNIALQGVFPPRP